MESESVISPGKRHPWKAIYQSWYSASIYRDAAHRWRGLGFRFLLAELFVLWLVAAVHVHIVVVDYVDGYLQPLLKALPKVAMKNGTLLIDKPGKYQITDPRNGRLVVNFDMTEKPLLPAEPKSAIFVEKHRIVFRTVSKEQIYDFKDIKELSTQNFDWDFHRKVLRIIKTWIAVVVIGVFWLSSFVLCALQSLVYGLLGKTMAIIAKRRLTYPQLVRISVVAMTPSLIIDTCQKLLCSGIPAWGLVPAAITLIYLAYGVKVNTVGFEWSLSQEIPADPLVKNSTP